MNKASLLNRSFVYYMMTIAILAATVNSSYTDLGYISQLQSMVIMSEGKNLDDNILFFDALTHMDPHDAQSWILLAYNYYAAGDYKRAAEAYNHAVALNPSAYK